MTDLPHEDLLTVPIQWSGATQKTTIQAAGYSPTVTMGWRPWTETATLEWRLLSAADANAMLDGFRDGNFNAIYDYQCNVRGPIKLQLVGDYAFTEEFSTKTVTVSVSVRRV